MSSNEDHTQFFARIHLHGLTKTATGEPCAIALDRSISFPAPIAIHTSPQTANADITVPPARPLAPTWEIEARVCFNSPKTAAQEPDARVPQGALGRGRSGLVYPLEIISVRAAVPSNAHEPHQAAPPPLPALCVKLAMPGYARRLARKAWFYKYLDAHGLTGVVAPRCYGVFHAGRLPAGVQIAVPGFDYDAAACRPVDKDTDPHNARMIEEDYDRASNALSLNQYFLDDAAGTYASSPWTAFRESPASPALTVLLMDKLGEQLTIEDYDNDWQVSVCIYPSVRTAPAQVLCLCLYREDDLQLLYDHLRRISLAHNDERFPNTLRAPSHSRVLCTLHSCSHGWNFVDWEGAILHVDNMDSRALLENQDLLLWDYYCDHGGVKRYQCPAKLKSTF